MDERRCKKGPEHLLFQGAVCPSFPSPKGTGEKKEERPDYKRHRAGTSQVALKMTERATGNRMERGICPPEIGVERQSAPEACKCTPAGPGDWS